MVSPLVPRLLKEPRLSACRGADLRRVFHTGKPRFAGLMPNKKGKRILIISFVAVPQMSLTLSTGDNSSSAS